MNQVKIADMSSLVNDPQNKKMYRVVSKNRVSNTNRTQMVGMLQLPDNSTKSRADVLMQDVACFCIHDVVRKVCRAGEKTCSDTIIIKCEDMHSGWFTIEIDYARFSKKLIKSAFEEQARNAVFSSDIKETLINHLLFNYLRSIMKEQIVEIPEKAGFYVDNGCYCYISHADGKYETDAVRQAKYVDYPTDSIDYQALKSRLKNDSLLMMLTVLDIASFMHTLLTAIPLKIKNNQKQKTSQKYQMWKQQKKQQESQHEVNQEYLFSIFGAGLSFLTTSSQ